MLVLSGLVGGKNINPSALWPITGDKEAKKMVTYGGVQMTEKQANKLKKLKAKNKQ